MSRLGRPAGALVSRAITRTEKSVGALLCLSGFFGLLLGAARATWQVPVETAQVLLGLVSYDHSSLPYAYHASIFSLLNYLSAGLLALTNSEVLSSIVLAALLGMLAMQTLALVLFVVLRHVYYAAVVGLLLGEIGSFGSGISYPILFMTSPHAFGRAGLMWTVLAISLIAVSWYRAGFFLCGLALAVHPVYGLWLNACLAMTFALRRRTFKGLLTLSHLVWYAAGVSISVGLFGWHKLHYPIEAVKTVIYSADSRTLFLNYIRYWDYHRQKFGSFPELANGLALCLGTGVLCFILIRRLNPLREGEKLFLHFIILSAAFGFVFVFVPSWADPARFPELFVVLMPGRLVGISVFFCVPLFVAQAVQSLRQCGRWSSVLAILGVLLAAALAHRNEGLFRQIAHYLLLPAPIVVGVALFLIYRQGVRWGHSGVDPRSSLVARAALCCVVILPVYLLPEFRSIQNKYPRISIPEQFQGVPLLTTESEYLTQLTTRSPVVLDVGALDGYAYVREDAMIALDRLLTEVYGISLAEPPRPGLTLHTAAIYEKDHEELWRDRSCEEWERLAATYHFGLVLIPGRYALRLPVVRSSGAGTLYLPRCN